jgi:acyl-CoA reductase-like NAD-dependent aldehyde dehydrogenase
MHSSYMLREGARPEIVRDNMGHANIDVTQNVYGKSWWEERVDAVTQAVETVTNAAQNAEKEEKKNQPESVGNEWVPPLAAPAGGQSYKLLVTDPTHR